MGHHGGNSPPPRRDQSPQRGQGSSPNRSNPTPGGSPVSSGVTADILKTVRELSGMTGYDPKVMVDHAELLAGELNRQGLTKTQMRKVYGFVRRIEARGKVDAREIRTQALLMKPKLAYTSARDGKSKPLAEVWDECLDRIHSPEDMQVFSQFAESVVAYFEALNPKSQ